MRNLLALVLAIGGSWFAAHAWLPAGVRIPLPHVFNDWALPAGAIVAALGLGLLLWRPPRRPAFGDGPIVSTLTGAGFRLATTRDGWQATGSWKGVPMVVRRSAGHSAGRFGRPWTIVALIPGQPSEPWPYLPEEGLIVDHGDHGFSVAMADLSRPERMHRLGSRLDELLQHRTT